MGVHTNQDLLWCVKIGVYTSFWVHRGSWLLWPPVIVVTQIRGHVAGPSPPLPTLRFVVPCIFIAGRLEPFLPSSTRVELRPSPLDALSCWSSFIFDNKSKSHHGGIRFPGSTLATFEGTVTTIKRPPGRPASGPKIHASFHNNVYTQHLAMITITMNMFARDSPWAQGQTHKARSNNSGLWSGRI